MSRGKNRSNLFCLIFAILLMASAGVVQASDAMVIEDFSNGQKQNWVPKKKSALKFTLDKVRGVLKFDAPAEQVSWYFCYLEKPIDLAEYPLLEIEIRSLNPGIHQYAIYINKKTEKFGEQSFQTRITLKDDKMHHISLDTRRYGSRSSGRFSYSKGKVRSLTPDGLLERLAFTIQSHKNSSEFEIKSIKMVRPATVLKKPALKMDQNSVLEKLHAPYQFKTVYQGEKIVIADEGKSSFVISIPPDVSPTMLFAAQTLQQYIAKVTQASLEIVYQPYIGRQIKLQVIDPEKNCDAFTLSGIKDQVCIEGRSTRAVLYGVYDFLEKACGIRFFAPVRGHEVIPQLKQLAVPFFEDHNDPAMAYRRFHYCSHRKTSIDRRYEVADWAVKNRYNAQLSVLGRGTEKMDYYRGLREEFYGKRGGAYPRPWFSGHNYQTIVSPQKYFKTHPEYFCWDKAKKAWRWERAQICCTNPDVVKVIADFAQEYFEEFPERVIFPLTHEDGSRLWCQCENCSKLDPPGMGYSTDNMADRAIHLTNAVKRELNRRGMKDKIVTFLAYSSARLPALREKPIDGIRTTYCVYTDETNSYLKPVSEISPMNREITQWAKESKGNVVIYNYIYCGFTYQFTLDRNLVENYRFYNKLGIQGNTQETFEAWGFDDYAMYLASRLAWDPWVDTDALRRDYFTKLYGPAADPMDRFRQICQNIFADYTNFVQCDLGVYPRFTLEHLQQLKACVDQAKAAAKGNVRVLQAVERKEKLYAYICAFSDTLRIAQKFFVDMTESNYQDVLAATGDLTELIGKLYRADGGEIVAYRIIRNINIASAAKRLYRQHVLLKKISDKYNYIEDLPVKGWKFQADPFIKGEQEQWYSLKSYKNWKPIEIAAFWEKQGGGAYDGFAYYQRAYPLPGNIAKNKKCYLYFLGVDEQAWVYVNGKLAGKHTGVPEKTWLEPFNIDITPYVKRNESNNVVIKVHDSGGGGGIWQNVLLLTDK